MIENLFQERLIPAVTLVKPARESNRLANGHPTVDRVPFSQIGNPGPGFRPQLRGIIAEHFSPAVARMRHAEQHLDRGRFARPIASQQTVDRSLGNAQVERINCEATTIVFRQPFGDNHVRHKNLLPCHMPRIPT